MSKDSKLVTVISVIAVVAAILLLGLFIGRAISGNNNDNKSSQKTNETPKPVGSTASDPIKISQSDMSLTGAEFAEKYTGKFISFDGLLYGTSTLNGAPKAHSQLLFGDDMNKGTFSDSSPFWITAGTSTFSDELQEYATNNSTPYETKNYPKVHVIAKVDKFNENNSVVQLESVINIDGKSPSVTLR